MTPIEALQKAVEAANGQSALARAIGGKVRQGHVWLWLQNGKVPGEHCRAIAAIAGDDQLVHHLRADIFGPAPKPERRKAG